MTMHIDKARQNVHAADVHFFITGFGFRPTFRQYRHARVANCGDFADAVVLYHDINWANRRSAFTTDESAAT